MPTDAEFTKAFFDWQNNMLKWNIEHGNHSFIRMQGEMMLKLANKVLAGMKEDTDIRDGMEALEN